MKKYLTGFVPVFTLLMSMTYFYAWSRLSPDIVISLLLALPFVLVWIIPFRFWSTDHSSYTPLDHTLHILGYVCMGLVNFLLTSLLITDFIVLLFRPHLLESYYGYFVFSLTTVALGLGLLRAHFGPAVREVALYFPNLPQELIGLRIVQISDLHVGPTLRKNYVEKVVKKTLALEPDLIVLTGDIVDGKISHLKKHVEPLDDLTTTGKAYFIMGNHDYYSGANEWIKYFQEMGIKVLLNNHDLISFRGTKLMLAGVTDPAASMAGHPRPDAKGAMRNHYLEKKGEAQFKILLAHNPKLASEGALAGFDLMLSGHTHAGQFFPWTLIVKKVHRPHYWGRSVEGKMQVYVSAGTGTWGPPIRLGTKTELTLLKLKRS